LVRKAIRQTEMPSRAAKYMSGDSLSWYATYHHFRWHIDCTKGGYVFNRSLDIFFAGDTRGDSENPAPPLVRTTFDG